MTRGRDTKREKFKKLKFWKSKALMKHELWSTPGIRQLSTAGGDANFSGLEPNTVYVLFKAFIPPELQDKYCSNCKCEDCTGITEEFMEVKK